MANNVSYVSVGAKMDEGSLSKILKNFLDFKKNAEKSSEVDIHAKADSSFNAEIKKAYDDVAKYYDKNLGNLNMTTKISKLGSKAMDESLPSEDRLKEIEKFLDTLRQLSSLKRQIGSETGNLSIFEKSELTALMKADTAIENAKNKLKTVKKSITDEIFDLKDKANPKNLTDIIKLANTRKIGNPDYDTIAQSLGVSTDTSFSRSQKEAMKEYYKTTSLMANLRTDYDKRMGGDLKDVDNLKEIIKLGPQLTKTAEQVENAKQKVIAQFKPDETSKGVIKAQNEAVKNIKPEDTKAIEQAKQKALEEYQENYQKQIETSMGAYEKKIGSNYSQKDLASYKSRSVENMLIEKATAESGRILKEAQLTRDKIIANAQARNPSAVTEEAIQKTSSRIAGTKEDILHSRIGNMSENDAKEIYAVNAGLDECLNKIEEIQNKMLEGLIPDSKGNQELVKYFDRANELAEKFNIDLKDEFDLRGMTSEYGYYDYEKLSKMNPTKATKDFMENRKLVNSFISDDDIAKADKFNVSIEESIQNLKELHAETNSKDFTKLSSQEQDKKYQDMLLWYNRVSDLYKQQDGSFDMGKHISPQEFVDITDSIQGVLPTATTAKTLDILRMGIHQAGEEAANTTRLLGEMNAEANKSNGKATGVGTGSGTGTGTGSGIGVGTGTGKGTGTGMAATTGSSTSTEQPTKEGTESKKIIVDNTEALEKITEFKTKLDEIKDKDVKINAQVSEDAINALQNFIGQDNSQSGKTIPINIDDSVVGEKINSVNNMLDTLPSSKDIVVNINHGNEIVKTNDTHAHQNVEDVSSQINQESSNVQEVIESEKAEIDSLANEISAKIPQAIAIKNKEFQNEQGLVEGVVYSEIQSIQQLAAEIEKVAQEFEKLRNPNNITQDTNAESDVSKFSKLIEELEKISKLIDEINQKSIRIAVDEDSNLDNLRTTFEGISQSVSGLNLDNLNSLSSILKNLSKESKLSENLTKVVDAFINLKNGMANGESLGGNTFMSDIKDILSQGDALKDFAKVISASSKKVKQAKKDLKSEEQKRQEKQQRKDQREDEKTKKDVEYERQRDELRKYIGSKDLGFGTLESVKGSGGSAILTFLSEVDGKAKEVKVSIKDMAMAISQIQEGNFKTWANEQGLVGKPTGNLMPDEAKNILSDYKGYYKSFLSGVEPTDAQTSAFSAVNSALQSISQQGSEATAVMKEFANTASSIRGDALEKVSSDVEKLNSKQGMTSEYYEKLDQIKTKIAEINSTPLDPDDEKEKNDLREINELLRQVFEGQRTGSMKEAGGSAVSNLKARLSTIEAYNSKAVSSRQFRDEFSSIKSAVSGLTGKESDLYVRGLNDQLSELKAKFQDAGQTGMSFFDTWKQRMGSLGAYLASFASFYRIIGVIKDVANTVRELDSAMIELQKVSDASAERLALSFEHSKETAMELGATVQETINATADWSRLGYSVDQAEELAKVAVIYEHVGDGIDINQANESLISTLQGFKMEASEAMDIVDSFNEVANNMPIDSAGIGEALQRSAASFQAAHTSMNESIALITGANAVVQDPSRVGKHN